MEPSERQGITTICLDPVSGALGYMRGGDNGTVKAFIRQRAKNIITTGTGLVYKVKLPVGRGQLLYQTIKIVKPATYCSVMPYLGIATGIGKGYINGVFVNIETYKCDTLLHDLPPWFWLCAVVISVSTE